MSKRTLALIAGLFAITALLVYAAISIRPSSVEQNSSITVTQAPSLPPTPVHTVLSMSPNPVAINASAGAPTKIDVVIDSQDNKITAVQLELVYDPQVLTITDLTPGPFFKNPLVLLKQIDKPLGRITYAIAVQPTATPLAGTGIVASILVTPKPGFTQQTTIQFLPKTLVTAEGAVESVLKSTTGVTITPQTTNP